MGLFSKKVTQVESLSLLLYEDTPNLVARSIFTSVTNDRPIADDLVANYLSSVSLKANQMYNYGKNTYTLGLPNGRTEYIRADDTAVKLVIERNVGSPVYLSFSSIEECNADYYAWQFMEPNRGWNYATDVVTKPPFTPVNIVGSVTFTNAHIVNAHTIDIYYSYKNTSGNTITKAERVPVVDTMQEGALFYHTNYYLLDDRLELIGERQYYNYNTTLGTEPSLTLPAGIVEQSPYYPIVPLRENNVDLTAKSLENTDLYRTSKACLKRIGLKFNELGDAINESPDINDVDHAYVILAVHLQSDVQNSIEYLHDYFSYLGDIAEYTKQDFDYWKQYEGASPPPVNKMTISDARLKVDIVYNYITKTIRAGSVGDIGEVTRTNTVVSRATVTKEEEHKKGGTVNVFSYGYEQSYVTFRKQIATNSYEEVRVFGLVHVNHIYGSYTVETTIATSLSTDNDDFWLPLHVVVSKARGLMAHEAIMYDSIRIVFNCITVTKLKWYETGFFKFVVTAVGIVLSVMSLGSMAPMIAAGLQIGLAAGYLIAAALVITVQLGFQLLIDVIGIDNAFFLAVAVVAAAIVTGNIPAGIDGVSFADALMFASSSLQQTIGSAIEDILKEITGQMAELVEQATETQKELDKIWEDLDTSIGLDPLALVRWTSATSIDTTETPEEFFFRTTHSGNIGVRALDEAESFVTNSLKLEGTSPLHSLSI